MPVFKSNPHPPFDFLRVVGKLSQQDNALCIVFISLGHEAKTQPKKAVDSGVPRFDADMLCQPSSDVR